MYSYMQMLISKIPAIVCAHLALAICSLRVKIDVWPEPNNLKTGVSFVCSLRQWFNKPLVKWIINTLTKVNLESILICWLDYYIKRYLYFSGWKGFIDRHARVGELYRDPASMWSKKARFHNVGNGGQFCWPLAWLTLNDLIFHLHWNPDSQTRKFLLGKLQTSESHCPPWFFCYRGRAGA